MRSSTRRKALERTAKIALGCCLGGVAGACGGLSTDDGSRQATTPPAPTASSPAIPPPTATTAPAPTATTAPSPTATASAMPPPTPTGSASAPDVPDPPPPAPMLACIAPIELAAPQSGTTFGLKLTTSFDLEEQACCEAYVEDLVNAGTAIPALNTPPDPSLVNCCRAFAYSSLWQNDVTHSTCCFSPILSGQDYNQPYCSPWGPPVPPALVVA